MATPEAILTLIVALATALGLREWLPGFVQQVTGRASRERERIHVEAEKARQAQADEVARLKREADTAEKLADTEACRRRILQEYISQLRVQLLAGGITPLDYPDTSRCQH